MDQYGPFIVVIGGSLFMGLLAVITLRGWTNGQFTCAEVVGAGALALLFFSLCIVPGGFPWNLFLLLIPVIYGNSSLRSRWSQKRLLRRMREEDYAKCERILARDPRNAAAYALLGQLYEEDERWREALQAYEEAQRLDSSEGVTRRRFLAMQERVGLEESGQVKCSGCLTVQPIDTGVCWKCGRVLDQRRAVRGRISRLGWQGRLALMTLAISPVVILTSVMMMGMHGGTLLLGFVLAVGIIACVGSATWLVMAYLRLLAYEAFERER